MFEELVVDLIWSRYGEIKEVWLDGAKGEGEKEMEYLFETWFNVIHQLQPEAIIFSDAGPDARWVGNEAGVGAPTCWSLFNTSATQIGAVDPLWVIYIYPIFYFSFFLSSTSLILNQWLVSSFMFNQKHSFMTWAKLNESWIFIQNASKYANFNPWFHWERTCIIYI